MERSHLASLAALHAATYAVYGRRRYVFFELCDSLLCTEPVSSLPLPSVRSQHQRQWGSLDDALALGQACASLLEQVVSRHTLAGGESIFVVDTSVWSRCDVETSPERTL